MKRIFSLALAFALLCAGITVRAAQHMIVGIGNPIDPRYTPILVLDSGDWEPDALRQELPSFYPCLLKGSFRGYACPVEWDLKAIDPSLPGRQWIPGLLLPDEDFALDQGLDSGIGYPVYLVGDGAGTERLTSVETDWDQADTSLFGVFPLGSDPHFWTLPKTAYCLTENFGEYLSCPFEWDLTDANPNKAGVYQIYGTPCPPAGFLLPEDFGRIRLQIGVVSNEYIDLSAGVVNERGNLSCQYLYRPLLRESIMVCYSTDGEDWQNDLLTFSGGHLSGRYCYITGKEVIFFLSELAPNTDYYFFLRYDVDQMSNILKLRTDGQSLQHSSQLPVSGMGGDRDGGDFGGSHLPDYSQPIPEGNSASEGNSAPEGSSAPGSGSAPTWSFSGSSRSDSSETVRPSFEQVTETTLTISGVRLRQLTLSGKTVLFERRGIAVEIPSVFLEGLSLSEEQLLEVSIRQVDSDGFSLAMSVGETQISALPPTAVRLPWNGSEPIECVDLQGNRISAASFDSSTSTVKCIISAPGSYRILASSPAQVPISAAQVMKETPLYTAETALAVPKTILLAPAAPQEMSVDEPVEPQKASAPLFFKLASGENAAAQCLVSPVWIFLLLALAGAAILWIKHYE